MLIYVWFCLSGMLPLTTQGGCISGNCLNGTGVYQFASGARYEGAFQNGKRQGRGTLTLSNGLIYQGSFLRDYREGEGRQSSPEGSVYTGQFYRDRYHGKGTMIFADGATYRGDWQTGKMHGVGELTKSTGDQYIGAFRYGQMDGAGVLIRANGTRTEGIWKEGRQLDDAVVESRVQSTHEKPSRASDATATFNRPAASRQPSIYVYMDGSRYEGTMAQGLPEGTGTCHYANGDVYTGEWSRHSPHGTGALQMPDGRRLQGHWVYGQLKKLTAPTQSLDRRQIAPVHDDKIRVWAVVVGIAPYQHMPALQYPDDDAYQMYAFLRSPEGGALPEDQIRLLINEEATRDHVIQAMQEMFGYADENDVILFYFSGHGLDGALLPADFDGFNNRLFYQELTSLLDQSLARQKLVIADACYSGSLLAAKGDTGFDLDQYYRELEKAAGGTAILLSSKQEEYSLEDKGLRAGVFSYYLRQGLKGNADKDQDGVIRIGELYAYIHQKVRSRTKDRQSPVLKGSYDENMPLAYLRPRG